MKKGKEDSLVATQISLHAVRNILGEQHQTNIFSEHDKSGLIEKHNLRLDGNIERFGIDLSDIQYRVMEALLAGFTETRYQGNIEAKEKKQIAEERYSGCLPETYKYLDFVPRLRFSQSKFFDWLRIDRNSIACRARALESLSDLSTKQYCFYYDRLVFDERGQPEKETNGRWKKEEVIAVDTLFTLKEVRSKGTDILKYYEVTPSPIFLDQRESYFMLVPLTWRDEVKSLVGRKKASSYTFRFLLFLRYQYELKRRSKKTCQPYQIKWSPEEIQIAIKMPESVYKRKKNRANQILDDAYSVAKRLGYLTDYKRTGFVDVLTLNDDKYFRPNDISLKKVVETRLASPSARYLFALFCDLRKKLDPSYQPPSGKVKMRQIQEIEDLLKARNAEDIEKLIKWASKDSFWFSRLSTISKLKANISEAWSVMSISKNQSSEVRIADNKKLAKTLSLEAHTKNPQLKIEVLSKYIEIGNGVQQPVCIEYSNKNFQEMLSSELRRWGVSI